MPVHLSPRLVPTLLVRNLAQTLAFYELLDFRAIGFYPDEQQPTWVEVQRDDITLQFHTEAPKGTPPSPIFSGTLYLYPSDVRALAEELRGKVDFAWGPEVMDYGMRELGIRDPNGYFLAFTEPA
ncbi:MAG: VOC family protein [Acidobacteriota bacterium]